MKRNEEYLKDIYNKYEQEKNRTTIFYKTTVKAKRRILNNVAVVLLIMIFATTGAFAGIKIYEKILMQASFTQQISDTNNNQIWCGTFQLVWNDLMDEIVKGPVEFEDVDSPLAKELNKRSFTSDMLSADSYYKVWGERNIELKNTIEENIKEKFNENSRVLEDVKWESAEAGYVLYAMLKKEFSFLQPFNELDKDIFSQGTEKVKYFGIDKNSNSNLYNNVEVLFYNSNTDFAVCLKTKENEDVILYRTNENTSFEDKYKEVIKKNNEYKETGNVVFNSSDTLKVPYINVSTKINYDELCNKRIKNTDRLFIAQAIQTIDIQLDNKGGKLISESLIEVRKESAIIEDVVNQYRKFNFDNNFVMFLKETDKEKPYFAIFVNDTQVLVK